MGGDGFLGIGHKGGDIAAGRIARDGLAAAGAIVENGVAAIGEIDIGELFQRQAGAGGIADEQVADGLGFLARGRFQNHVHIKYFVAFVGLRGDAALVGGLDGFQYFDRAVAKLGQAVGAEFDDHARGAGRRGDLNIGGTGYFTKRLGDFIGLGVEHVEVIAENIHDNLGGFAGDGFADAVAEEGEDFGLHAGIFGEGIANLVLDFFLVERGIGLEFHVHFAAVRAPGIFAHFGAANLFFHALDAGNLENIGGDLRAETFHFPEGGAGRHGDADHKMAFAEIGEKFTAEERQRAQRGEEQNEGNGDDGFGPAADAFQPGAMDLFQPAQIGGFRVQLGAREQGETERGRDGERHEQRGHDGENEGEAKRREELALQTAHQQHRQEDECDDEGGVHDGAPHFQRGFEHHGEERTRLRQREIFAQAAQDVFDVNDGIVHDHADGYGEAAKGHGVQRDAKMIQHHNGGEQRERNGDKGNKCGTQIEQEKEQHHAHEHCAEQQRGAHVVDGNLNKRGGAVQAGNVLNALGGEDGFQFIQRSFHAQGNVFGVGAVLAGGGDQDAGFAINEGVAKFRRAGGDDVGDVFQEHAAAGALGHDDVAELFGGGLLAVGLDDKTLGGRFHVTGAAYAGGLAGGGGDILHGNLQGGQAVGSQLDLQLADFTAEDLGGGHAGNGEHAGTHGPVGKGAEFHGGQLVRHEAELEEVHGGGGERLHFGRLHAGGEVAVQLGEALGDHLARLIDFGAFLEDGGDDRQALDGFGADGIEIAGTVEGAFHGAGDEGFHLFGGEAGSLGLDGDLGLDEVGEDVELGAHRYQHAAADEGRRERDDHAAFAQ